MSYIVKQPNFLVDMIKALIEAKPKEEVPRQYEGYPAYTGKPDYPIESDPFIDPQLLLNIPKGLATLSGPIVAMTRHELLKSAYKLGVKELDKPVRREFVKAAYRVKPEHIKSIDSLEALPETTLWAKMRGGGRLKGLYIRDEKGTKILSEPLKNTETFRTPFHEVAHNVWTKMDPKDKASLRIAYDDMWPKHKIKQLSQEVGTSLHNHEEVFSEAFSYYITGSDKFWKFPPTVRDMVRKYTSSE